MGFHPSINFEHDICKLYWASSKFLPAISTAKSLVCPTKNFPSDIPAQKNPSYVTFQKSKPKMDTSAAPDVMIILHVSHFFYRKRV